MLTILKHKLIYEDSFIAHEVHKYIKLTSCEHTRECTQTHIKG